VIGLTGALLAAASLALSAPPEPRRLSLLDVPFISQSEALCGGAAAAMVLRYWGESGVAAEDFAHLVDRASGGIRTVDLEAALRARGSAIAAAGTAALARTELTAGRPVIALIEDRPGVFHYVVLVGWHESVVVVHDPARTPFVVLAPGEFLRRWCPSGSWMLAFAPGASGDRAKTADAPPSASEGDRCGALVGEGVRFAQNNDLASAERRLAEAVYECPGAAALRELAGVRLLQRRWPEVRVLAQEAVARDARDEHAWRLLATARYIDGDPGLALDAWNAAGEPVLDLVSVGGLHRTTHRSVERALGLETGRVLTRGSLDRGRRRLADLPAAFATRVDYVALGGGRAEVRAHVAERPVIPQGWLPWAVLGARAAAMREVVLPLNSLAHSGERLEASWRFWPHRPAIAVSLALAPTRIGALTLDTFAETQPFTDEMRPPAERLGARAELADWATGAVRWHVRGGYERWRDAGGFGLGGGGMTLALDRLVVDARVTAWAGASSFLTGGVGGRWLSSGAPRGVVWTLRGDFERATASTPLDLWVAGDTGHARPTLLRAHPLVDEGRLRVERLGRQLTSASAEVQRWWRGPGPLALGAALFVDAAHTARRVGGSHRTDTDAGIGVRLAMPGDGGRLRLDLARGLSDGKYALSIAWAP